MIIKPSLGMGGVYMLSIVALSFNLANEFFVGIWVSVFTLILVIAVGYIRFPRKIEVAESGLIFDYFNGKSKIVKYKDILHVREKGPRFLKGRILFIAGGYSDILNYSLLSGKSKDEIIGIVNRNVERLGNPNKQRNTDLNIPR
ncbi:MAG: hypothetical protein ABW116_10965 [Candidatus Sedimenticola sp. 20ELBAFRAG]